jgi:hypothetical protein
MGFFLPRLTSALARLCLLLTAICYSFAADETPQVALDVSKTGPRAVESLTERSIQRDYKFAWQNLALAMESNSPEPLDALFAGSANAWLKQAIISQKQNGLSTRYLNQSHKLEAVFYAPEGDVIELHDIAEYDVQIFDGDKSIHSQHLKALYVVLMTPGADRWVVRQLQAVPQF